jgi:hypothetical protein
MPQESSSPRLLSERLTIQLMISIYCHDHHQNSLCPDCTRLLTYAFQRIEKCPFGVEKPTCARCPIHCYKPATRQQVRQVMRYAGPRMLLYHPWLTILHYLDEIKQRKRYNAL